MKAVQATIDRFEDITFLLAQGESPEQIAARFNRKMASIERAAYRHGRTDIAKTFYRTKPQTSEDTTPVIDYVTIHEPDDRITTTCTHCRAAITVTHISKSDRWKRTHLCSITKPRYRMEYTK